MNSASSVAVVEQCDTTVCGCAVGEDTDVMNLERVFRNFNELPVIKNSQSALQS